MSDSFRPIRSLPRCSGIECARCDSFGLAEWGVLDPDDAALLNEAKVCNPYHAGDAIFHQGAPALGVYCVQSGTIATRRSDEDGNSCLIRLFHHGQTLGYEAEFTDGSHAVSAEALGDALVCFIDKKTFQTLLDGNSKLSKRYLSTVSENLQADQAMKLQLVSSPLRTRLASMLLDMRDYWGQVDDAGVLQIDLPLSRQQLASLLGARPESVSRAIRQLQDDGVAKFNGRTVMVPDLDPLFDEARFAV